MSSNVNNKQNASRGEKNRLSRLQTKSGKTPNREKTRITKINNEHFEKEQKRKETNRTDDDIDYQSKTAEYSEFMNENENSIKIHRHRDTQANEDENEKMHEQIEIFLSQEENGRPRNGKFIKTLNDETTIPKNDLDNKTRTSSSPQNTEKTKINLRRCVYSVVQDIAKHFDMEILKDESLDWDVYWSDASISSVMSKHMKVHQRISHFPGLANLESKSYLAFHLNRMLERFPSDYNVYPKSWILPQQTKDFYEYAKLYRDTERTFIIKPTRGAEGKGIILFRDIKEVQNVQQLSVCQTYISNLLLMDGFKFDLRIYILISSIDPLRLYVYNNGIVRLATCKYKQPETNNITNQFMHLTNYSINKHSTDYNDSEENGSKRDFIFFNNWLQQNGYNESKLWREIDDLIIKTIISTYPILKNKHETLFPEHESYNMNACFEILGFDVLIDTNLKPFLLEVNRSPSFNISGAIDERVKRNLILDTFKILNLNENRRTFSKSKTNYGNRAKSAGRDSLGKNVNEIVDNTFTNINNNKDNGAGNSRSVSRNVELVADTAKPHTTMKEQIKWEIKNCGNYRLVYPNNDTYKYTKYFNHSFTLTHLQDNLRQ